MATIRFHRADEGKPGFPQPLPDVQTKATRKPQKPGTAETRTERHVMVCGFFYFHSPRLPEVEYSIRSWEFISGGCSHVTGDLD